MELTQEEIICIITALRALGEDTLQCGLTDEEERLLVRLTDNNTDLK
jgi:hypothetical protein